MLSLIVNLSVSKTVIKKLLRRSIPDRVSVYTQERL